MAGRQTERDQYWLTKIAHRKPFDPTHDSVFKGFTCYATFNGDLPACRPVTKGDELGKYPDDMAAAIRQLTLMRTAKNIVVQDASDAAQNRANALREQILARAPHLPLLEQQLKDAAKNLTEALNDAPLKFALGFEDRAMTRARRKRIMKPNSGFSFGDKVRATQCLNKRHVSLSHLRPLYKTVQNFRKVQNRLLAAHGLEKARQVNAINDQKTEEAKILADTDVELKAKVLALAAIRRKEGEPRLPSHLIEERVRHSIKVADYDKKQNIGWGQYDEVTPMTKFTMGLFKSQGMHNEEEKDIFNSIYGSNCATNNYYIYYPTGNTWLTGCLFSTQESFGVVGRFDATQLVLLPREEEEEKLDDEVDDEMFVPDDDELVPTEQIIHTYEWADNPQDPTANEFSGCAVTFACKDGKVGSFKMNMFGEHEVFRNVHQPAIVKRYASLGRHDPYMLRTLEKLREMGLQEVAVMIWQLSADMAQNALSAWYNEFFRVYEWQHPDLLPWCEAEADRAKTQLALPKPASVTEAAHGEYLKGLQQLRDKCEQVICAMKKRPWKGRFNFHADVNPPRSTTHLMQFPFCDDKTKCTSMVKTNKVEGKGRMYQFLTDPHIDTDALLMCRHMKSAYWAVDGSRDFSNDAFYCKRLASRAIVLHCDDSFGLHLPVCCPKHCCCEKEHLDDPRWIDMDAYCVDHGIPDASGVNVPEGEWTFNHAVGPYPTLSIEQAKKARNLRRRCGESFAQGRIQRL